LGCPVQGKALTLILHRDRRQVKARGGHRARSGPLDVWFRHVANVPLCRRTPQPCAFSELDWPTTHWATFADRIPACSDPSARRWQARPHVRNRRIQKLVRERRWRRKQAIGSRRPAARRVRNSDRAVTPALHVSPRLPPCRPRARECDQPCERWKSGAR